MYLRYLATSLNRTSKEGIALIGRNRLSIPLLLLCILIGATPGLVSGESDGGGFIGGVTRDSGDGGSVIGMSNPAADYCVNKGYELKDGRCYFPDGSYCEEWAFYRGECSYDPGPLIGPGGENPASVYCTEQGYNLQIKNGVGHCIFPDGSSCEEWAFYRGECHYNPKPKPDRYHEYCTDQGYRWQDDGSKHGLCVFPDGTYCSAVAFYDGSCKYNPRPPSLTPVTPTATYTCQPPLASDQGAMLIYDVNTAPPSHVYYQGAELSWSEFGTTFLATSPAMWVDTTTGWSWNVVCPIGVWIRELMYLPGNGAVNVYEIYPNGIIQNRSLGQSSEGYRYIWFYVASPGRHTIMFTVDEVPSNAIFMDVKADESPCGPSTSPLFSGISA